MVLKTPKKKVGHYKNINFLCASAELVPLENSSFDYYIISFGIRNVTDIKKTLKEAYRLLKPGGRFMCLEFSKINNEIIDKFYSVYSNLIPHIGKLVAITQTHQDLQTTKFLEIIITKVMFASFLITFPAIFPLRTLNCMVFKYLSFLTVWNL